MIHLVILTLSSTFGIWSTRAWVQPSSKPLNSRWGHWCTGNLFYLWLYSAHFISFNACLLHCCHLLQLIPPLLLNCAFRFDPKRLSNLLTYISQCSPGPRYKEVKSQTYLSLDRLKFPSLEIMLFNLTGFNSIKNAEINWVSKLFIPGAKSGLPRSRMLRCSKNLYTAIENKGSHSVSLHLVLEIM